MKMPDMYGNDLTKTDSFGTPTKACEDEIARAEEIVIANLPEDVKELIKSYMMANDCLTLANESQKAEIEDLRAEVERLKSETADYRDWL